MMMMKEMNQWQMLVKIYETNSNGHEHDSTGQRVDDFA
jgi:hypothetical protein